MKARAEDEGGIRRVLNIRPDSDAEMDELRKRGFTPTDVSAAFHMGELGPRDGMSSAARLLRGIRLGIVKPDSKEPDDPLKVHDVLQRKPRAPRSSGTPA